MRKLSFVLLATIFICVNVEAQIEITNVKLIRVYDGDTFFIKLPDNDLFHSLFGDEEEIGIRIRDIDAYGITKREKSEKKRATGIKARDELRKLLESGNITLHDTEIGLYGRLLAHVKVDGKDVGEYMLKKGYAEVYSASKNDNSKNVTTVELVRVYDGDTFFVIFPDDDLLHKLFDDDEIGIRIRDVSAYEITKREKSEKKRKKGIKAKNELIKLLKNGHITLHNIKIGTFRRLIADVKIDGKDVGEYMLKKGYVEKYKK